MNHAALSQTGGAGQRPVRTFADLLAALPGLGYSDRTMAQIRPQILRSEQIYRQPLARIPADPAAFETRWGRGRDAGGAIAAGFRTQAQFVEWRRRVRMALERAARPAGALPAAAPLLPGWATLVAFCIAHQGGAAPRVPSQIHVSLRALGTRASALGIDSAAFDSKAAAVAFRDAKGRERRTLRCGLRSLSALVARRENLPEIAGLLPAEAGASPPPTTRRTIEAWRDDPALAGLKAELAALLRAKADGPGRGALAGAAARDGIGPRTRAAYERAVRVAVDLLREDAVLPKRPSLVDVTSIDALCVVEERWHARIARGEVRKDATTLRMLLERLVHLGRLIGVKPEQERVYRDYLKHMRGRLPSSSDMSPARLEWIKAYAASPAQQRAVHGMPERLKRAAEAILQREEAGETVPPRRRMEALTLGTAAAMSAILVPRGAHARAEPACAAVPGA